MPADTADGSWTALTRVCNGVPGNEPVDVVEVTLTVQQPSVTCDFVDAFDPIGTLQVIKNVDDPGGARTGAVIVAISCSDGTNNRTAELDVPPGSGTTFSLPDGPMVFRNRNICSVSETATGAAAGAQVAVTSSVTVNGPVVATGQGQHSGIQVDSGDTVVVTVTDSYTPAVGLPETGRPPAGRGGPPGPLVLLGMLLLLGATLSRASRFI